MPRKTSYQHPNLYNAGSYGPVLDLEKGEFVTPSPKAVHPIYKIYEDFEEYFDDLREFGKVRRALKIPEFTYVAANFCSRTYPAFDMIRLVSWAREFYEVRWWVNNISASMLICIADTDLTEKAGWDFYTKARELDTYKTLHSPSWWEFCHHGVQIPADWKLEVNHLTPPLVKATSPDGKLGMIEEGAYADIILVDGNPLKDLSVIGASPKMFGVPPRPTSSVDTIPFVMKDGKIYKNNL